MTPRRSLQARERKIARCVPRQHQRQGKTVRRFGVLRIALNRRSAGKAQPHDLGGLVERFARRIVKGGAEPRHLAHAFHDHQLGMPARHQKQQIGKGQSVGQPRRQGVTFQMVHRQQGQVSAQRDALGGHQRRHHPADQARPGGRGDAIEIKRAQPRLFQHACSQTIHTLGMSASGDLGHHAAKWGMGAVLSHHRFGQNFDAAIAMTAQHGGCGVIAARFQTEHG
jgi:hypothetical protein